MSNGPISSALRHPADRSAESVKRAPAVISFSGMDGSGKSTQIDLLKSSLSAAGYSVACLAFWDNVVAFSHLRAGFSHKFLHSDGRVGAPDQPVDRRDKNTRAWYLTLGRSALYFLDALRLRSAVARAKSSGLDIVIFDRYIYDQLATLSLSGFIARRYASLILRMVPRPDVAILLDAEPEAARARKPEYPISFLKQYRASYLELHELAGLKLIPALPLDEVRRAIWTRLQDAGINPIEDGGNDLAVAEIQEYTHVPSAPQLPSSMAVEQGD
jgi:thymidylate kinase